MKLDPGIHIVKHLVFFGKSGVTSYVTDVSDKYNNLKAAWDSLVEAANHGHPHGFQVAVTVVLEQLKREQLKKQRKD
jgi:hypothetical protein